jgi:hypothetical protein
MERRGRTSARRGQRTVRRTSGNTTDKSEGNVANNTTRSGGKVTKSLGRAPRKDVPNNSESTTVVHIKRRDGKVVQDCDVYIGRAWNRGGWNLEQSKWHNPFKGVDRDTMLTKYEAHVRSKPDLMEALGELKGKRLGCWCKPEKCHGDVLVKLVNEKFGVEKNNKGRLKEEHSDDEIALIEAALDSGSEDSEGSNWSSYNSSSSIDFFSDSDVSDVPTDYDVVTPPSSPKNRRALPEDEQDDP